MALKIKKLFQKNTQPQTKRDNAGRFTSGTGGLKAVKKLPLRRMIPVIAVIALTGGFLVFQSMAAPPSNANWKLEWSDEFNGSTVDKSKWTVLKNSNYGSGNRQDECNRAENVTVSGGMLNITGKRETVQCVGNNPDGGNNTYYFTSGMVTTRRFDGEPLKFKYRHGYIEARIKSPRGNAYWPAFWLVGPNDGSTPGHPEYGEFDIYEGIGSRPDSFVGTAHFRCRDAAGKDFQCHTSHANAYNLKTGSISGSQSNWGYFVDSQTALNNYPGGGIYDFVTYGFEWDEKQIAWYVNGKKYRYMDDKGNIFAVNQEGSFVKQADMSNRGNIASPLTTVFNYEKSIILNLAIGGNMTKGQKGGYTGNETATGYNQGNLVGDYPGVMQVDYVRVYKKDGSGEPPLPPSKLAAPTGIKAVAAERSAVVSWNKPADGRVNQYQVRYKIGSGAWVTAPKTNALSTTISGLAQGTTYDFQVQSLDSTGKNPASDYSATVSATIPAPVQTGLRAAYFPKGGFHRKAVYKTDPTINFDLGWAAPFAGAEADFHARWSGQIIAPVTGTYTFTTISDDGMNLWIGGKRIIESWKDQYLGEKSATIQLTAGQSYDILAEYYDSGAGATAQLLWQYPGVARQIVPTSALRPTVKTGLSGRYYSANGVIERNDKTIDFNWGAGALGNGVTADNALVNWVGTVAVPTTGEYTFTSLSDDGFSMHVDGQNIINDWTTHSPKENSGKIRLEAGKEYSVSAAYFEKTGNAVVRLYWTGPGIAKSIIPESAFKAN